MADKGYPIAKYNHDGRTAVAQNAAEDAELGKDWFDHPADAAAGKILSNVGRAAGQVPAQPVVKPPLPVEAEKPKV